MKKLNKFLILALCVTLCLPLMARGDEGIYTLGGGGGGGGGSANPGGSSGQVQDNNNGSFGGFTYLALDAVKDGGAVTTTGTTDIGSGFRSWLGNLPVGSRVIFSPLPSGKAYYLASSLTIPATVTIQIMDGGPLTLANGSNLTFNGNLIDGFDQMFIDLNTTMSASTGVIFASSGASCSKQPFVRPEWWGWTFDSTTGSVLYANYQSLQRAAYSVAGYSGIVQSQEAKYLIGATTSTAYYPGFVLPSNVSLQGIHRDAAPGGAFSGYASSLCNYYNWQPAVSFKASGNSMGIFDMAIGCLPNANPTTWLANHAYSVNSFVYPATFTSSNQRFVYVCSASTGNSGGSEPSWPTTLGGTVVDGSVTWTAVNASLAAVYSDSTAKHNLSIKGCNLMATNFGLNSCGLLVGCMNISQVIGNIISGGTDGIRCYPAGGGSGFVDSLVNGNPLLGGNNASVWAASTAYTAGVVIITAGNPTRSNSPYCYICDTAGTSGSSQPGTWNNSYVGQKTTDNTVVWRAIDPPSAVALTMGGASEFCNNIGSGGHNGLRILAATNTKFIGNDFNQMSGDVLTTYHASGVPATNCSFLGNKWSYGGTLGSGGAISGSDAYGAYLKWHDGCVFVGEQYLNNANYGACIDYANGTQVNSMRDCTFYNNTNGPINQGPDMTTAKWAYWVFGHNNGILDAVTLNNSSGTVYLTATGGSGSYPVQHVTFTGVANAITPTPVQWWQKDGDPFDVKIVDGGSAETLTLTAFSFINCAAPSTSEGNANKVLYLGGKFNLQSYGTHTSPTWDIGWVGRQ